MTDQPPVQPPARPPNQPQGSPAEGDPATRPMPTAGGPSAGGPSAGNPSAANPSAANPSAGIPPAAPGANVWRRATATRGRRIGLAAGAFSLAFLMVLGFGLVGLAALRLHDRGAFLGDRGDRGNGFSRGEDGPGSGRGPGMDGGDHPRMPDLRGGREQEPGMRGGQDLGPGGFGNLLGATPLHGSVTATVNGVVQSLLFQRGEVTAVSATSITLKSSDGFQGTYGRTADTISRGAVPVKGQQALVVARSSDKVAVTTASTGIRTDVTPND